MTETAWVLVPREAPEEMLDELHYVSRWGRVLSAVPPIPRDVFEQMVERGARALAYDHEWLEDMWPHYTNIVEIALRAALGQKVEGDE